jgi:fatty-acyl-CoA synthase
VTRPTVSTNSNLPFRVTGFGTLTEGLDYAAQGETGYNFFSSRGDLEVGLTYREIRDRAIALAQAFEKAGFARGTRVAIIAETSPDFLIFFFACQYAGMLPVPLPLDIYLGARAEYVNCLRNLLSKARATVAIADEKLIDFLREAADGLGVDTIGTFDEFTALPAEGGQLRPFQPDESSYIQFSSGSTMAPRGVLISQRAITSNAAGIAAHGLCLQPGDRGVSWLPLYHDMGLVGFCLTPMMSQVSVDALAPQSFARRPLVWLKLISEHGGTLSFSPNFGYELCVRRGNNSATQNLDLSRWRVAGIGGEMIYAETLNKFAETFADCSFSAKAFLPCYGQSESTLAITFAPLNKGLKVERIDQDTLANEHKAVRVASNGDGNGAHVNSRPFVACGMPLPDHQLQVRDEAGNALPDENLGQIFAKGPSLMDGYYMDPAATSLILKADGWMDTGDLGYISEGQLVITGRQKDLIILNGRNIWPQDIEEAVKRIDKIGSNDVACFSVSQADGGERIIVVAHCRVTEDEARMELRKSITSTVRKICGSDSDIVLAAPRTLRFTSSGKLSRALVKEDYCAGEIADLTPTPQIRSGAAAETNPAVEKSP